MAHRRLSLALGWTEKGELKVLYIGPEGSNAKKIRTAAIDGQVPGIVRAAELINVDLQRVRDVSPPPPPPQLDGTRAAPNAPAPVSSSPSRAPAPQRKSK